jgi:hypothetical protein
MILTDGKIRCIRSKLKGQRWPNRDGQTHTGVGHLWFIFLTYLIME